MGVVRWLMKKLGEVVVAALRPVVRPYLLWSEMRRKERELRWYLQHRKKMYEIQQANRRRPPAT